MRPKKDKGLKKIHQGIGIPDYLVQVMRNHGGVQKFIDALLTGDDTIATCLLFDLVDAINREDNVKKNSAINNATWFLEWKQERKA